MFGESGKNSWCVVTLYLRILFKITWRAYLKWPLLILSIDNGFLLSPLKYIADPGPVSHLVLSPSNPTPTSAHPREALDPFIDQQTGLL